MKILSRSLIVASCLLASIAQAELKIGVVNMNLILSKAPQLEKASAELEQKLAQPAEDLKAEQAEIKGMEEQLKKDESFLSSDQIIERKKEIIQRIQEFKAKEAGLNQQVQQFRQRSLADLRNVVQDIVDSIAANEKYDIVFYDGVAFASPKHDLTPIIIKKLSAIKK